MLAWLVLIALALAGLFFYFELGSQGLEQIPALAIGLAVVSLLVALYAAATRPHAGDTTRQPRGLAYAAVIAALVAAAYFAAPYINLTSLVREATSLDEQGATTDTDGFRSVRVRRNAAGQFLVRGAINGNPTDFLVDTGASAVILKSTDAEKAGVSTEELNFTVPVATANGQTFAAPVKLRSVSVGPIRIDDVEGLVAAPGNLNESLLGISFLTRLSSYELTGNFLTLRQ